MKKNGFLFFFLAVGLSPLFSSAATIATIQPSLWLKPNKGTDVTCGVVLGVSGKSGIKKRKDCSFSGNDTSHLGLQVKPQRYTTGGTNFHPRVSFKNDTNNEIGWLNGSQGDYFSTFIVWNISELKAGHVPFQVLPLASSMNNRFVKVLPTAYYSTGSTTSNERDLYKGVKVNGGENKLTKSGPHIYYGFGANNGSRNLPSDKVKGKLYRIGPKGYHNPSPNMKNDDIYEIISFPTENLSVGTVDKVESYLAIKYGIPLKHDYFDGNGTKVYDRSTYENQVFGLGKDSSTSLDQRIAKPLDDDTLIISSDNDFSKLNDEHTPLVNNGGYLLLGNNGRSYTNITTEGLEKSAAEQYFTSRSEKVWKVQNTGFNQDVNLQFSGAFTGLVGANDKYVLLASSDVTKFSELNMIVGTGELKDGKLVFTGVQFPAGVSYITVAIRDLTAPKHSDNPSIYASDALYFSGSTFPLTADASASDVGVGIYKWKWTMTISGDTKEAKEYESLSYHTDQTNVPEGYVESLNLVLVDRAGNSSESKNLAGNGVYIDRTPPVITFMDGKDEVWINVGESIDLSGIATGSDNSTSWNPRLFKVTMKSDPESLPAPFTGSPSIIYTATDIVGNSSKKERTIHVNEAPVIEGLSVNLGTTNDKKNPIITFTPKDDTRSLTTGKIEIYEGGTSTLLTSKELASLTNGNQISESFALADKIFYTVKVKIRDEGGLFAEEELSYPPTVNFEPASFKPTSGDVEVTVKIWSPGPLSEVKFDGPFQVKIGNDDISKNNNFKDKCSDLGGGNYSCQLKVSSSASQTGDLKIIATDNFSAGNNTLKLIIDKTKPTKPVFTLPLVDASQNTSTLKFQWESLTDEGGSDLDKIYWSLKRGDEEVENGAFSDLTTRIFEKSDLLDGSYTLTLWTQDKAGNKSDEAISHTVQIDTTAPNEIKNLTSAFDPDTAKLTFSRDQTTDTGVGLSGYLWTLKKGSQELIGGMIGDEANPALVFENIAKENATYTLSLQAVDKVRNTTAEINETQTIQLVGLSFVPGEHISSGITTYIQLFSGAKQENLTLPTFIPESGYKLKDPLREPNFVASDRATANKTFTGNAEKDPSQRVELTINHQGGTGTKSPVEVLKVTELKDIPLASSKTGFILTGWAASSGGTLLPGGTKFSIDTELFVLWEKDASQWITISFDAQSGAALSDKEFIINTLANELPIPQKSGYTFSGWNYTGEAILSPSDALTKSGTLYANWTEAPLERVMITYNYNYFGSPASLTSKLLKAGATFQGLTPEPIRTGYIFKGRFSDQNGTTLLSSGTSLTADVTVYAKWESKTLATPGYSGGGGTIMRGTSTTETTDTSPKIDQNSQISPQGETAAYEWAYRNGITTLYPESQARLYEPITRAELAKMMSVYAMKFLEKAPLTGKVGCADFQDINQTSSELANFMKLSCELEIMGLQSDGKTPLPEFRPNDAVSRAEFATVLSRMRRGNQYDNRNEDARWEDHLKNLNEKQIIKLPDPKLIELRGWILLMLYRLGK